jgi:MFS superfamily sulfate permease-like transporter
MKLFNHLKQDIPASIVVLFVAIPLCLGIAMASGAPLFSGLISGIIGGIIVGSISGSALGVSGPAAGLAVIVLTAIQDLGSFEVFLLTVVLAGLIQLILGIARAGIIGYFFPSSVIKGMLSGIGIIIALKQIPHAVGHDEDYEGDLAFNQADGENTITELIKMWDSISINALIISVVSLLILIYWERVLSKKGKFFQLVQGPIVVVVLGIIYQKITLGLAPDLAISPQHLVNVPVASSFGDFLGQFSLPDFSALGRTEVYITAITIAIVASLETLLSVEATDKLDPHKRITPTNRELVAQGAGNMISGLIGGLPVTQVIVRSSANVQSGGRTKLAGILHGVLLLISVIVIPELLNYIPLAVLAAILILVGYKLAKPSLFKRMYKLGTKQFLPFIATVVAIVFTDLLIGIGCGMAVAFAILIRNNYLNSHFLHKIEKEEDGTHKVTMILSEEVTFLNKGAILKELNELPEGSTVTIDIRDSFRVDYDVYEIIANFKRYTAADKNITVGVLSNKHFDVADY